MGMIRKHRKIDTEFICRFYDAWLREDSDHKVAETLEINHSQLWALTKRHEELQTARRIAEQMKANRGALKGYIFKHLSPEAKETWERIQFWESNNDSTYSKINQILQGKTTKLRQELFLHALVSNNYDLSEACRIVSVPRSTVDNWREKDLEFRQMIEEIQWHKKNFFERALLDLVEQRYPGAVLFVNRTQNADRGYNERMTLEHQGEIGSTGLRIDELDLDLETRKKILDAMRKKKIEDTPNKLLPQNATATIDVEIET